MSYRNRPQQDIRARFLSAGLLGLPAVIVGCRALTRRPEDLGALAPLPAAPLEDS